MRRAAAGQRGVALVTAMIIAFVAVAAATDLTTRQQLDIRRTETLIRSAEGRSAVEDIERAAVVVIASDRKAGILGYAEAREIEWPGDAGGQDLSARLEDPQRLFNLNALAADGTAGQAAAERFRNLLGQLGLDASLANAVIDWVDDDGIRREPGGAEDDVYSRKPQPYRAANQPFARVQELRLVHGVTDDVYRDLAAYIAALPVEAGINVNVADPVVLRSLAPEMSAAVASRIVDRRSAGPFAGVAELLAMPELADLSISPDGLTTESRYFRLNSRVSRGGREIRMRTEFESSDLVYRILLRSPEES